MRAIALLWASTLLASGCGGDPCDAATGSCITFDVRGDVGMIDSIGISLSGPVAFQMRAPLPQGVSTLPVLVGIGIGDVEGSIHADGVAGRGGSDVAAGQTDVTVARGAHVRTTLTLVAISGEMDLGGTVDLGDAGPPLDLTA